MRTLRHSATPSSFVAAKTSAPIPVAHRLVRDALVQAALDPSVRAIEYIPSVRARNQVVPLDAVVLGGDDGRRLLDIVDARPLRSIDDEGLWLLAVERLGLPVVTLTAADIHIEPRAGNSRLVWACCGHRVPAGDRVRVLQVLAEEGEMTLAAAAAECRFAADPVGAVLALVCADLIEADLAFSPLSPETRLRRRPAKGGVHG